MNVLKKVSAEERRILRHKAVSVLENRSFCTLRGEVLSCCATAGLSGFTANAGLFNPTLKGKLLESGLRERILTEAAVLIIQDRVERVNRTGRSLLVATINTNQLIADKALTKAGFKSTGWAYRNPDISPYTTGVKVYVKHAHPTKKEAK